jgi:hypothetical protein
VKIRQTSDVRWGIAKRGGSAGLAGIQGLSDEDGLTLFVSFSLGSFGRYDLAEVFFCWN